ncbi:cation-translocating P-type ATPase [Paucilactobacillus nenjiangensis]|uniref:Cation-transporting P-type ATPase n=1 Tax=Paucilactobacillus nenjiangensis TaxID=1296540 RepID=A0A5P1X0R1_9LACO|nr:cation-transporting P-type ATPase [Paucilactobacillus nenjiangensis]QER66464.1 cation-transporting P-type ATPase [Paucilactobacillus nenjiangensis]
MFKHKIDLKSASQDTINALIDDLNTTTRGISSAEAAARLEQTGPNEIQQAVGESQFKMLMKNFISLMAILLWVGGIIAILAGMTELGLAIWAVNIINGGFSFWQERSAQRATSALKKMLPTYVHVYRDDKLIKLEARDLVPGDVFNLQAGDSVSADARLITATSLEVDQSSLTGETVPEDKQVTFIPGEGKYSESNLIYAGTTVGAGTATAVAFRTGMQTEFGQIAELTENSKEEVTPLQQELDRLTKQLSMIAIAIGILFFILAVTIVHYPVAKSFIFALGMIVAFIPEGLLPTVTLSLAQGVQRMAKRHALVKNLNSVETLGETTVICSDKTGTLTQNQMTVTNIILPNREFEVTGRGYVNNGKVKFNGADVELTAQPQLDKLLQIAALDNDTRVQTDDKSVGKILGTPTEAALIVVAKKAGISADELSHQYRRLKEYTFDSSRKRMSTINQIDSKKEIFTKGGLDEVIGQCDFVLDGDTIRPIQDSDRVTAKDAEKKYAAQGLRSLAMAYREVTEDIDNLQMDQAEAKLIYVGQAVMMDPPRPEVFDAIKKCKTAQIRIIMVTGDSALTAKSIGQTIGIVGDGVRVITGDELDAMSNEELKVAVKQEVIFARVAPEHKFRIVSTLQTMGEVVASTGDGVNDAPALKKADIGVAMGVTGTDVAKDAADMILTDDNFVSIVSAIEEGRAVYSNIQKFLLYILTSNVGEAMPSVLFLLSRGLIPLPLTVMQILTIDIGTDMLPALGLGSEKPEPGIMNKAPRNPKDHLMSKNVLWRAFGWYGMIGAAVSIGGYFWINHLHGWPDVSLAAAGPVYAEATTMTLAAIIFSQIASVMNSRSQKASVFKLGVFSNHKINFGILVEILILLMLMYVAPLREVFGTTTLQWQAWLYLIVLPIPIVLIENLRKRIAYGKR